MEASPTVLVPMGQAPFLGHQKGSQAVMAGHHMALARMDR